MRTIIHVNPYLVRRMRRQGGVWFAYATSAAVRDSSDLRFLQAGPHSPHLRPPPRFPDTRHLGAGFAYLLIGRVNLESGKVELLPRGARHPSGRSLQPREAS